MRYLSQTIDGKQQLQQLPAAEFENTFDVIVCGLGTAGALAAIFAAENGLSVLGVEMLTCTGGTHTAGGVPGHYFGCPGGRFEQIDQQVKAFSQQYTCTAIEGRKLVLEKRLRESGVQLAYKATPCGVYLEDQTVIGLQILRDGKIWQCGAKVVLDCTAEASVAVMAGCETECGRKTDGQMQPYSLVSMIYGNEKYRYTNIDFGRVNQYDPWAFSEAILFSRAYPIPEMRDKILIAQMPLPGFREGRRIIAEERVCLEDLFADKQTCEPIFYSYADLDKHGWDIAFDGEKLGDWSIGANLGAYNVTIAIPWGSILPKGYEGILVPCRALGVDRDISSCVRMVPDMKKLAEAAAQWVTLAVKNGTALRQVSYEALRKKLEESECLKEADNRGVRIDGRVNWDGTPLEKKDVCWITDPEELPERLATETPGLAIWSAKRIGQPAVTVLCSLLDAQDENTRKHAAFALAMLGNDEGVDLLRDMVCQRDGLMLKDCRKHNNLRGCVAIYWLGRLGDREIVPELLELIGNEKEIENPVYHAQTVHTTRYAVADFENIYFQFMSQAVMALVRIGERHPDLRSQIGEGFFRAFSSDAYYDRITTRPKRSSEGNMTQALKNVAFSAVEKWQKGAH